VQEAELPYPRRKATKPRRGRKKRKEKKLEPTQAWFGSSISNRFADDTVALRLRCAPWEDGAPT